MKKILAVLGLIFILMVIANEKHAFYMPQNKKVDLSDILIKDELSQADYDTIFSQTGLSRLAVDDIKKQSVDFRNEILEFQEQYFSPGYVTCSFISSTTKEEVLHSQNGAIRNLKLAPLQKGDLLITKSTHTFAYRHGHVAVVANSKQTIESIVYGSKSNYTSLSKWGLYPTLLVLRMRNITKEQQDAMVNYLSANMCNLKYSIFCGRSSCKKTYCSHLAYCAYNSIGVNIDSDGGVFIKPSDIVKSNLFEPVQVYGFDNELNF